MEYILSFVLFSSTCTMAEITTFKCKPILIEYTDIYATTRDRCQAKALNPKTKLIINENYSNVWVVPTCEPYTREIAQKINYNLTGI